MQSTPFVSPAKPLAPIGQTCRSNLPAQLTSLVGREQEITLACSLLRSHHVRLLTLIGPGGVGKTRLALQVATNLLGNFPDGVYFIPLAPVSNADMVIPTIAQVLGLGDTRDLSLFGRLKAYIQDKYLLLLLDNYEQVLAAAPLLAEMLCVCPKLKIIVTSRAVLHVRGEQEFPVLPLPLPDLRQLPPDEVLSQYASIELFKQRAMTIKPEFAITPANIHTIATICAHLDGLPLAIELAAARIKLLSPEALLKRLAHRFNILTSHLRDLPVRHQTLRNTIQWSYDLLNPQGQWLFRQLSIFVGGSTLEAVEALCISLNIHTTNVLDSIESLIDNSLLQQIEQMANEPRLVMLETIRAYGLERLEATGDCEQGGEAEKARYAHAAYYIALAESAERELGGPQQAHWLGRLEREHDNLRSALAWLLEKGEMEKALHLSAALWWFWSVHGHLSEGRQWLEKALVGSQGVVATERAKALNCAGMLAITQDDHSQAFALCTESLALYRELGDRQGSATSLYRLGLVAWARRNHALAYSMAQEAYALFSALHHKEGIADSLLILAYVAVNGEEYARALSLMKQSLTLFRELDDTWGIAYSLLHLAPVVFSQEDAATAYSLVKESLALSRDLGYKGGIATALCILGEFALQEGNHALAQSHVEQSLAIHRKMGDPWGTAESLFLLAKVTSLQGDTTLTRSLYEESLTIYTQLDDAQSIASCLAKLKAVSPALEEPPDLDQKVATQQPTTIMSTSFQVKRRGRFIVPTAALSAPSPQSPLQEKAQDPHIPGQGPLKGVPLVSTLSAYPDALTSREVDVLRLIAIGLTDIQVAAKLVISRRTVNAHLTSIYSKIHVSTRSAATHYAHEHQLL